MFFSHLEETARNAPVDIDCYFDPEEAFPDLEGVGRKVSIQEAAKHITNESSIVDVHTGGRKRVYLYPESNFIKEYMVKGNLRVPFLKNNIATFDIPRTV